MQHFLPYLNWIDHMSLSMKDLVIKWANINTHATNFTGLEACMLELKKSFSVLGGEMEEVDLPPYTVIDDRANHTSNAAGKALVITKRKDAPIRILLNGHMDTVFPKTSSFQTVRETDHGTLVGPGVTDMKGGLAIMLFALEALEKSPYAEQIGWQVIITPDEEIGSPSSCQLLEKAAKQSDLGLVFEPCHSDASLVTERPAAANLTITIRGKAAHAGRDYTAGRSALVTGSAIVNDLQKISTLKPGDQMPQETLGKEVIVNVGEFRSGNGFNIVSDLAILRVNLRAGLASSYEEARKAIDEIIAKHGRQEGIWIELFEQTKRPARHIDSTTRQYLDYTQQCSKELGLETVLKSSCGVSDANIFSAAGLAVLDSMGPIGGKIHTHDEYLVTSSLALKAKIASLLLMKIGSGEYVLEKTKKVIEL